MINLKCRTEFSFRTAYGKVEQILDVGGVGICDRHGTWGHVQFAKAAKKKGIKPVFGVELAVVSDMELKEKQPVNYMSFIALTNKGLKEVYELTTLATEKSYYIPRIDYSVLYDTSDDIVIISGTLPTLGSLPRKKNIFFEMSPLSTPRLQQFAREKGYRTIACSDNFYPKIDDRRIYEIVAGKDKDSRTVAMHILDEWEWTDALPWADKSAIETAKEIYSSCAAVLPTAEMVHYEVKDNLFYMCGRGAVKRGIDIVKNLQYKDRMLRELELIKDKQFEDYFYVIADMVNFAKNNMLVGPARGSSCGSLVCYLLGITDIDPIPHNLLFERFIDITREDLPDIDIDFQDDRREIVFDYLREKYGSDKVARLGTVSRYKAKSTIVDVSKELNIPAYEVHDLKEAIIERSGGDSRASFCILDTFDTLEIGKKVIEKFPELKIAAEIEGHARHSGQHAAGIIVTAHPITNYCSVDKRTGAGMLDKKDAEELGLLKIDALGLRTLSILQDVLDSVGMTREQLLAYPTNDEKAFQVIRDEKFSGIFQFEGFALQNICRQMPISEFNDLAVITALARPGPLTSGGTTEFVKRRTGRADTTYLHELAKEITKDTYGVIVYQEQVMQIARIVGKLSWEDVSNLRKAMSKSLGKEFFDTFKIRFLTGAKENGIDTKEATHIWENINTMGSWAFNKSHAVAYGMVSYWCCILKAYHPMEFAAACLRNSKSEEQVVQFLRELVREGYKWRVFDKDKSKKNWSVVDGEIIGGYLNLKGCGDKMADDIIKRKNSNVSLTNRQLAIINNPVTPFDNVFECQEKFGDIYNNPKNYDIKTQISFIHDISEHNNGSYTFIGKLLTKNLRDLNEAIFVQKRGGKIIGGTETKMLNCTVCDDTGTIRIAIDRRKYFRLGKPIVEEGQIGDWYIFRGDVRKGFLQVQITNWRKLK